MALTGDFAALRALIGRFKAAHGAKATTTIAADLARYSDQSVRKSFAARQSPDGAPHVPGPYYRGLRRSGKLAGGFVSRVSASGFTLRNKARYAFYHQNGAGLRGRKRLMSGPLKKGVTRRRRVTGSGDSRGQLPARPILPSAGTIPGPWVPDYRRISERTMSRILGR
jgi:phage gpG-like protein